MNKLNILNNYRKQGTNIISTPNNTITLIPFI